MMKKLDLNSAFRRGMRVVLPITLFIFGFKWVLGFLKGLIRPITTPLTSSVYQGIVLDFVVWSIILMVVVVFGLITMNKKGEKAHLAFENKVMDRFPGYSIIKGVVAPYFSMENRPFSSVVLIPGITQFSKSIGFVVDDSLENQTWVHIPWSPNPLTGFPVLIDNEHITYLTTSVDKATSIIIAFGAGAAKEIIVREEGKIKSPKLHVSEGEKS